MTLPTSTPRTDAARIEIARSKPKFHAEMALSFAGTLERDLARLRAELAKEKRKVEVAMEVLTKAAKGNKIHSPSSLVRAMLSALAALTTPSEEKL